MRPFLVVMIALWIALASAPRRPVPGANPTPYSDAVPPARFQDNAGAELITTSPEQLQRICAHGFGPILPGMVFRACTIRGVIYIPNPCPGADPTAHVLCHEIGHINGWPASHGD